MTLAEALQHAEGRLRAAGVDDARLEAEVLFCHALGITRERLYVRLPQEIEAAELARYESLLLRRLAHEPLAYITGHREFYGLDLACTPDALVPRPETELLVELALDWLRQEQGTRNREQGRPPPLIVDVGTGNGAIAVAIAANAPNVRVIAVDVSRAALRLAQENARGHGVAGRIEFVRSDLLSMLRGPVDVIVANLPYVPARLYEKLPPEIREHEPSPALRAGRRGTSVIERLIASASGGLQPGGLLVAEHAWNQGRTLREAARASFPEARIETKRDLSGKERALVVRC